jgi:hypothetical protein
MWNYLVVEVALGMIVRAARERAVSRGDSCDYASLLTRLIAFSVPLTRFDRELLPSRRRQPKALARRPSSDTFHSASIQP